MQFNETEDNILFLQEIKNSLREWGIDPNIDKTHKDFYQKTLWNLRKSVQASDTSTIKSSDISSSLLSKNEEDAICYILRHHLENTDLDYEYFLTKDKLSRSEKSPYTIIQLGHPKLKKNFRNCNKKALNPFNRFSYKLRNLTKKKKLELALESIVTYHVICKQPCIACKKSNVLRWNCCAEWEEVICVSCSSSYKIQSTVFSGMKFEAHTGQCEDRLLEMTMGSFPVFHPHQLKGKSQKMLNKRYLIMVNSTHTMLRSEKEKWVIDIAEIDEVVPKLCALSFIDTREKSWKDSNSSLTIKMHMIVKNLQQTLEVTPSEDVDIFKIAEQVNQLTFSLKEVEIRSKMKINLQKVGVKDEAFHKQVLKAVTVSYRASHCNSYVQSIDTKLVQSNLSMNLECAIRQLLLHVIETVRADDLLLITDKYGRYCNPQQNVFKPSHEFTYKILSRQEYFYMHWFNDKYSFGLFLNHVFKAIVANHGIFNEPCVACKKFNVMQWNGASSSWGDIICRECNSSYTIESKAYLGKEKQRNMNRKVKCNIPSGSFRAFHLHRAYSGKMKKEEPQKILNKNYLIITDCTLTLLSPREQVWVAGITEINRVDPRLCNESFCNIKERSWKEEAKSISIRTSLFGKETSSWNIPYKDIDFLHLAKEVYIQKLSEDAFNEEKEKSQAR